ncbi:MAG: hypothetical protein IPK68_00820 [Bdellovibrionales bacterium]|nr:hypothetical protein [Bdellovibrionales bacterium]
MILIEGLTLGENFFDKIRFMDGDRKMKGRGYFLMEAQRDSVSFRQRKIELIHLL